MRRVAALIPLALAAAALLRTSPAVADDVALEIPAHVDTLRAVDVDGDGISDVVALAGRTVLVWTGAKDALPPPRPRWRAIRFAGPR